MSKRVQLTEASKNCSELAEKLQGEQGEGGVPMKQLHLQKAWCVWLLEWVEEMAGNGAG